MREIPGWREEGSASVMAYGSDCSAKVRHG